MAPARISGGQMTRNTYAMNPSSATTAATPHTAQHTVPALRMRSTIEVEGTGGPSTGGVGDLVLHRRGGARARAVDVVGGLDAELELDPPHPLERALRHDPVGGDEVGDDAEREDLDGRDEQHAAERRSTGGGRSGRRCTIQSQRNGDPRQHAEHRSRTAASTRTPGAARSPCRCGRSRRSSAARSPTSSRRAATRAASRWCPPPRGRRPRGSCPPG